MSDSNTFTTSGGVTLTVRPVSQMLVDKVKASVPRPKPPKYADKIALPGTEPVIRYYTMKDGSEASTPEEVEAWDNYVEALGEAIRLQNQRMVEAILVPGAGLDIQLPADDTWIKVQEYLGIEVPKDEIGRKAHYLMTEILTTGNDLQQLILEIMKSSGVSEEDRKSAEESFRNSVRERNGAGAERAEDGQ